MLTWIVAAQAVTEIALLALLGQWVLGLLGPATRERNPFYRVLQVVGHPFVWLARRLSPRWVLDRHVPLVAFVLLAWAWLAVTWLKLDHCLALGEASCR